MKKNIQKDRKKRIITIGTFDFIKGIGIMGVVMGHVNSNYMITSPILLFILGIFGRGLMPMFFMISGFGNKINDISRTLIKSTKQLLIPYIYTAAAVGICFPIIHYLAFRWWPGTIREILRVFLAFVLGCPQSGKEFMGVTLYECTPMWYVLALFWATNLANLISSKAEKWGRFFLTAACVILGYFMIKKNVFWYWCIPQGLMAVGYFKLGRWIKEKKWIEKKIPVYEMTILVLTALAELFWGNMSLPHGVFAWGLSDYIGAGCIGLLLLRFGVWTSRFAGRISERVRCIGRYSYWIMCLHAIDTNCIPWYLFAQKFESSPNLGFFLEFFLRSLLLGICCIILDKIFRYRRKKGEIVCHVRKKIFEKNIRTVFE